MDEKRKVAKEVAGTVLIVDDDLALAELLRECLLVEEIAADLAYDGETGLAKARAGEYQLIILDVMLPGLDGFSVLMKLRQQSKVPVLMLTAKDEEIDKVSGLRMGADDYLTKPFGMSEFLARVHSLIRRYTVFQETEERSAGTLQVGDVVIDREQRTVWFSGRQLSLTGKEFEVFTLLAAHPGRVFTKQQIYQAVWKDDFDFDENNLMSYLSKLRKKLESQGMERDRIETVWGVGYRFKTV